MRKVKLKMRLILSGDEFRIPFRMHIEGYKYKEIADDLGLKIGTVKVEFSSHVKS